MREREKRVVRVCVWGPKAVESGAAESQENRTEQKASEVKRRRANEEAREGKGRRKELKKERIRQSAGDSSEQS